MLDFPKTIFHNFSKMPSSQAYCLKACIFDLLKKITHLTHFRSMDFHKLHFVWKLMTVKFAKFVKRICKLALLFCNIQLWSRNVNFCFFLIRLLNTFANICAHFNWQCKGLLWNVYKVIFWQNIILHYFLCKLTMHKMAEFLQMCKFLCRFFLWSFPKMWWKFWFILVPNILMIT